jgi:hypothetical protein
MRQYFSGHKTKLGAIACIVAGALKVAGLWEPILDRISDGLFYSGVGLCLFGIWARVVSVFYPTPKGKADYNRPKLKAKTIG